MIDLDPYAELGIDRGADAEAIRRAYRQCVLARHPDRGGDEEAFKRAELAYTILSDPVRRREYDETGAASDVNNEEDLARRRAMDLIAGVLQNVLRAAACVDDNQVDVVARVAGELRGQLEHVEEETERLRISARRHRKLAERIKRKDGRDEGNFLEAMALAYADQFDEQAALSEKRLAAAKDALKLLEDFRWEGGGRYKAYDHRLANELLGARLT